MLRKGELIDQGTHEELLARCDLYRRIFARYDRALPVATREHTLARRALAAEATAKGVPPRRPPTRPTERALLMEPAQAGSVAFREGA